MIPAEWRNLQLPGPFFARTSAGLKAQNGKTDDAMLTARLDRLPNFLPESFV
jgi:hypothetical protein